MIKPQKKWSSAEETTKPAPQDISSKAKVIIQDRERLIQQVNSCKVRGDRKYCLRLNSDNSCRNNLIKTLVSGVYLIFDGDDSYSFIITDIVENKDFYDLDTGRQFFLLLPNQEGIITDRINIRFTKIEDHIYSWAKVDRQGNRIPYEPEEA